MKELVSIFIPTFNRSKLLKNSLKSALNQDYSNLEIIVSDNASTDNTEELIRSFKEPNIFYSRNSRNIGLINNWQKALELCNGEYFLALSDDDILKFNAISTLINIHKYAEKKIAFSYGHINFFMKNKLKKISYTNSAKYEDSLNFQINNLKGKRIVYPSATLIKTSEALSVGGYEEKYRPGGDVGLLFKLSKKNKFVGMTNQIIADYYYYSGNESSKDQGEDYIRLYSELFRITESINNSLNKQRNNDIKSIKASTTSYFLAKDYLNNKINLIDLIKKICLYRKTYNHIFAIESLIKLTIKIIVFNISFKKIKL